MELNFSPESKEFIKKVASYSPDEKDEEKIKEVMTVIYNHCSNNRSGTLNKARKTFMENRFFVEQLAELARNIRTLDITDKLLNKLTNKQNQKQEEKPEITIYKIYVSMFKQINDGTYLLEEHNIKKAMRYGLVKLSKTDIDLLLEANKK
jgi:Asp-tRNA(Asn)/Glu-tRNA(Gln) amidotransferase B subunit